MGQEKFITEQHRKTRSFFRFLGPLLLIVGGAMMLVAFIDFFTLQGFEEPKYFWLFFVAIPLLFVGFILSGLGFGGSIAKYQSREYAPVAKDTFNYLAKETTSGVKEISNALQLESASTDNFACPHCNQQNTVNAKFCNECGEKIGRICSSCKQVNSNDANFCDECGTSLT